MYGPLGVSRNFNILVTPDFCPVPIKFRLDIILLKKKKNHFRYERISNDSQIVYK